jgi:hypothetical protein
VIQPGNWLRSDRVGRTQRWQNACLYNLLNLRYSEYAEIAQRRDFYLWFYEATARRGYHTRWALAAYIVASGMAEMAEVDWSEGLSPITNELQGLTRIGNQVIFDDVLPKLRELWLEGEQHGPVVGEAALRRDAQILADEQTLIDAMYRSTSQDTMQRFERVANMYYDRVRLGRRLGMGGRVQPGPFRRGNDVPTFSSIVPGGNIALPRDRWRYGMGLGARFSTLPSYGPPGQMPAAGPQYQSGAEFRRLNVRPHLHMIDAMLNDIDVPDRDLVGQLRALSEREQRELLLDQRRIDRLAGTLSFAELRGAVAGLRFLPLEDKLRLLERTLVAGWTLVEYSEVQQIIQLAGTLRPVELRMVTTERWRRVFLDICDDQTIILAVRDLQLSPDEAREWIAAERGAPVH